MQGRELTGTFFYSKCSGFCCFFCCCCCSRCSVRHNIRGKWKRQRGRGERCRWRTRTRTRTRRLLETCIYSVQSHLRLWRTGIVYGHMSAVDRLGVLEIVVWKELWVFMVSKSSAVPTHSFTHFIRSCSPGGGCEKRVICELDSQVNKATNTTSRLETLAAEYWDVYSQRTLETKFDGPRMISINLINKRKWRWNKIQLVSVYREGIWN